MSKANKWEKFLDNIKMTRRTFLKASAATAGVVAVSSLTGCNDSSIDEETYEIPSPEYTTYTEGGEWFKSTCPRNCHDTCSFRTQVIDGKITRLKGDETNPYTAGNLCAKMNNYINYAYDPNRLLYPMKRTGKKGSGEFKRISWDEAYSLIAKNTNDNVKKYGPNSIAQYFYSGTLGYVSNYSMPARYFNKVGATGCEGTICLATGQTTIPYTYGTEFGNVPEQYANTKLYVSWGTNEAATGVHQAKFIKQCQENGGKVVVINSTPTPVSNFADLFIRIHPGSDTAFALAVANIIISENLYDANFVGKYTEGFEELKKEAAKYTLEKAEEITGVSQAQILEFARLYGSINPSIIRIGYGMQRHTNGGSMVRAITFLPALTGNIGKENAGYVFFNLYTWDVDWGILGASNLNTNENYRSINMISLAPALNNELESTKEEPIKQLFVFVANPLTSTPDTLAIRKGMKRDDLFVVVSDIFHTETVDYANVVLPCTTLFEQDDLNQGYLSWYISLNQKAIEPIGESKSNVDMFAGLAKAMGYTDKEFDLSGVDIIKETLDNAGPLLQDCSYDTLVENGWYKVNPGVPHESLEFPTSSGKIEFYSESIQKDWGIHPVAEHVSEAESKDGSPDLFKKYPLQFLTLSTKNLLNGQLSNLPHIQALIEEEFLYVHPTDASERGLVNGEIAIISNDRGECKLPVKISSEKAMPGVVLAYKSPWQKFVGGENINATTSYKLSDVGNGSTFHTNLVQVTKA